MKLTPPKYGLILGTMLRMKYDAMRNKAVKKVLKKRQKEIYYYPKCFLKLYEKYQ
jgi:hypothetical protein